MINKTKTSINLIMILLLTYQVSLAQENKTAFSLQEAIDYALINNQNVKNTDLEMQIAEKKVGEILSDGLPQVTGSADLGYNYQIQQSFVAANTFDPTGNPDDVIPLKIGVPYVSRAGVNLNQMIFDGSFFVGLKAAKTFTELSKKDHIKSNIEIAEAVSKAYFGLLVNRERKLLVERNFNRIDSLLQDTKVMLENGFAEKIDVSRVQVQYNNAKVELENFQSLIDLSEMLLKFQMGLDLKLSIVLTNTIVEFDMLDFTHADDFSYEKRIEYATMNIQKELNVLDIKNIKSQYVPKLDFYASYGKNTGALQFDKVFSGNWYGAGVLGLKASVPIFDGFKKSKQIQQRRLKSEQIENSLRMLQYNIDIEIEQSVSSYNREVDKMNAQKENMQLAREVYDVTKVKYKEGVGSNSEVLDADANYKIAQTNYYNALYDALISKVNLQKAYGILL